MAPRHQVLAQLQSLMKKVQILLELMLAALGRATLTDCVGGNCDAEQPQVDWQLLQGGSFAKRGSWRLRVQGCRCSGHSGEPPNLKIGQSQRRLDQATVPWELRWAEVE